MMMLTILILECFFHFEKNAALYEDANFKKMLTVMGVAMIASGILLTQQMSKSDALPTQNKWLTFFPPKFFMSLLLTPISDKLALILVGHRKLVTTGDEQSLYEMSNDWK